MFTRKKCKLLTWLPWGVAFLKILLRAPNIFSYKFWKSINENSSKCVIIMSMYWKYFEKLWKRYNEEVISIDVSRSSEREVVDNVIIIFSESLHCLFWKSFGSLLRNFWISLQRVFFRYFEISLKTFEHNLFHNC